MDRRCQEQRIGVICCGDRTRHRGGESRTHRALEHQPGRGANQSPQNDQAPDVRALGIQPPEKQGAGPGLREIGANAVQHERRPHDPAPKLRKNPIRMISLILIAAHALRRAGRRPVAGQVEVGRLPAGLLSPSPGSVATIPPPLSGCSRQPLFKANCTSSKTPPISTTLPSSPGISHSLGASDESAGRLPLAQGPFR